MNIEEKAQAALAEFKKQMMSIAEDAVSICYGDIIPHIESDHAHNTQYRAQAIIKNLLAGNFKAADIPNSVVVCDDNGIDTHITISDLEHDRMRDNLIKAMPTCPKDLKIRQLEETIKSFYEHS